MKESRMSYKAERPKGYRGFEEEKLHHTSSRYKTEQRNKEVRNIDRAIRTKDYKALLDQDMD